MCGYDRMLLAPLLNEKTIDVHTHVCGHDRSCFCVYKCGYDRMRLAPLLAEHSQHSTWLTKHLRLELDTNDDTCSLRRFCDCELEAVLTAIAVMTCDLYFMAYALYNCSYSGSDFVVAFA